MRKAIFAAMMVFLFAFSYAGTIVGVGETVPLDGGTTTTTDGSEEETTPPPEDGSGSDGPIPQVTITPADGSDAASGEGSDWENSEILGVGETSGAEAGAEETAAGTSTPGGTAPNGQPQPDGNGEDRTGTSCSPALVLAGFAALALFAKK